MIENDLAIQVDNLVKRYRQGVLALDKVSIKIEKGDIVGYLGPNGAGKTTTIKILTNLLTPTSGHAYIKGIDVNRHPKEALRAVGALIEVPGVYGYLTPHEMLTYFGKVAGMSPKEIQPRIEEVLEVIKLSQWEHKKLESFSTGMQRRFAIAKAILHEPEVLILDEPVLGLDPKGMKDVRDLIKKFQKEGMTILLSSHLLQEVSETCDNVIFIDKGKLVTTDSVENILNGIKTQTIDVKFLRPLEKKEIKAIEALELIDSIEMINDHIRIHFDGEPVSSSKILSEMISSGFEVVSFAPQKMGLEEFYISVMGDESGVK